MNKRKIIEELDILKLKILMDDNIEYSELKKYEEWVKNLQGRGIAQNPWHPFINTKWAEYRQLAALVFQLYHEKYSKTYYYQKELPKIERIISETVAMVLYIQSQIK